MNEFFTFLGAMVAVYLVSWIARLGLELLAVFMISRETFFSDKFGKILAALSLIGTVTLTLYGTVWAAPWVMEFASIDEESLWMCVAAALGLVPAASLLVQEFLNS